MASKVKKGFLYLLEVHPRRPWLHKVGITQNPPARFESLSENSPIRLLRVIHVRNYEKREAWLKDYFSNRAVYFHPLRGNGATEVFRFTWLDLAIVTLSMEWWALKEDPRVRFGLALFYTLAPPLALYALDASLFWLLLKSVWDGVVDLVGWVG